jgi:tetratricopeptide (TPR) repeat protein
MNPSSLRRCLLLGYSVLICATGALAAEPSSDLVKAANLHDEKHQPAEALKLYLEAEKAEPKNAEIATRIARQYRRLMSETSSKQEKLKLGQTALEYSRKAAALGPNDSEAQLSTAITLGKMLPHMSSGEQVDASPKIKASVDRAIALDSSNDLAWHILGRWHRNLANISGIKRALAGALYGKLPPGSNEEAVKCLDKAIAIDRTKLMHQIEMGRIYAQMGRKEEARKYLIKGLSMPTRDKDDAEAKEYGRETLAKL